MHSKDWQSTKHTDPSAAVSVRLVRPFSCHPQFFFHPPLQVNADVFITCVHHVCSVFIHIMCVTNCINLFLLGLFICFFTCLMILMALCGFAKFEAFAAPPSCCNTCQECELELFGRNDCSSACFQCQSCSIQYVFNMCSICVQSMPAIFAFAVVVVDVHLGEAMLWRHGTGPTTGRRGGREASAIFSQTASRRVCRLITSAKASIMKCLKASQGPRSRMWHSKVFKQIERKN